MHETEHLSSLRELMDAVDVSIDLAVPFDSCEDCSIELAAAVQVSNFDLPAATIRCVPAFERSLLPNARGIDVLQKAPVVRTLGKLTVDVNTQGWRFPAPGEFVPPPVFKHTHDAALEEEVNDDPVTNLGGEKRTRLRPPSDMVMFKDRLLYLLQPPLEDIFQQEAVSTTKSLRSLASGLHSEGLRDG